MKTIASSWRPLSEAAEVVTAFLLAHPEVTVERLNPHERIEATILRHAFASGEVRVTLFSRSSGSDDHVSLSAEAAAHELFSINLGGGYVSFGDHRRGGPYDARVHMPTLATYLRSHTRGAALSPTAKTHKDCLNWLVTQMPNLNKGAKGELASRANLDFGIGAKVFQTLWTQACKMTNRIDLTKGGRPKTKP